MNRSVRLAAYVLPGLLLTLVAANQVRLAFTRDLSPWKGGGFGMFASTDGANLRLLRSYLVAPGGRASPVRMGKKMKSVAQSAILFPSDSNLERVARHLAEFVQGKGISPAKVRLEFWRLRFDGETAMLHPEKGRDYLYEVRDGG